MKDIDLWEYDTPQQKEAASPAEKARREAVVREIASTDFSLNPILGGVQLFLRRRKRQRQEAATTAH